MKIVLALGSNLGELSSNLNGAIDELRKIIEVENISKFHETSPVGGPVQPNFLNAVIVGESSMTSKELLHACQEIEKSFGRVRSEHWGPRTLDIDLIIFGSEIRSEPELTLPHPLAHLRKFVLEPWVEIDPDGEIPGKGKIRKLLAELK